MPALMEWNNTLEENGITFVHSSLTKDVRETDVHCLFYLVEVAL